MSTTTSPALRPATFIPTLPDSAPFTAAQRAWLNGFFAGMLNNQVANAADPAAVAAVAEAPAAPAEADPADEEFPWHDPALAMDERLALADGKPKKRKLMAAMAQLDCGACGYLCQTYAEAIASGTEKDLTKCAPGGRDTSRKLKELNKGDAADAAQRVVPVSEVRVKPSTPALDKQDKKTHGRNNPFPARLLECTPLNKPGSAKDTRLVAFDLKGSGLAYTVGDSLGVFPENCPDTVHWLLEALNASGAEDVPTPAGTTVTLHEALLRHYQINKPSPDLLELLAHCATDPAEGEQLRAMSADDGPGAPDGHELIDLLKAFPSARPSVERFVTALSAIQPRLYSIASSLRAHPEQVHLTVGIVRYVNSLGRQCKGVASTFLGERVRPGQKVSVFVQHSHGFRLPTDGNVPVIMVGPGTGIAPFRAFLQERKASGAAGKNWLFFGDQRSDHDFLYRDELDAYGRDGVLTRLDTAFSRDQREKVYVQTRMLQQSRELWKWLQEGAHFYVCGDAKRMAADVDAALRQVVAEQGKMTAEAAKAYTADMAKAKRYLRDVY